MAKCHQSRVAQMAAHSTRDWKVPSLNPAGSYEIVLQRMGRICYVREVAHLHVVVAILDCLGHIQ